MNQYMQNKTFCCLSYLLIIILWGSPTSPVSANEMVNLPVDLEVELALSALPENLQAAASIYLLDEKRGYVLMRQGSNGFVAFVGRTSTRFYQAEWDYEYPSDHLIPIAYDGVGSQYHMQPWFDLAKMRAEGVSSEHAKQTLAQKFDSGIYSAPQQDGISYMLAPIHRAYSAPEVSDESMTVSFPHYMPYAPHVSAVQLGNSDPTTGPFVLNHGAADSGPHGYMVFMLSLQQADKIRTKYMQMLQQLCELSDNWCLTEDTQH